MTPRYTTDTQKICDTERIIFFSKTLEIIYLSSIVFKRQLVNFQNGISSNIWVIFNAIYLFSSRMWWTITGNFGNILPIDWTKSFSRKMHIPTLNLSDKKVCSEHWCFYELSLQISSRSILISLTTGTFLMNEIRCIARGHLCLS